MPGAKSCRVAGICLPPSSGPKDNCRLATTGKAEVLSRSKGDQFLGTNREIKAIIAERVISQGIASWQAFQELAAEYGEVKIRNAGTAQEYLNIKPYAAEKGINLRDSVFRRAFIELPHADKESRLGKKQHRPGAADKSSQLSTEAGRQALLGEWAEFRSREIKYQNSGNKKRYQEYQAVDQDGKARRLADLEQAFYTKNGGLRHISVDVDEHSLIRGFVAESQAAPQATHPDNPVAQQLHDHHETEQKQKSLKTDLYTQIKQELPAQVLLESLSVSHGLPLDRYQIEKGADGGDRIRAGKRRLNVADFLTKEMHFAWADASRLLQDLWERVQQAQKEQEAMAEQSEAPQGFGSFGPADDSAAKTWKRPKAQEWMDSEDREQRRLAGFARKLAEIRDGIWRDPGLSPARKRARLAVTDMEELVQEAGLRDLIWDEQQQRRQRALHTHPIGITVEKVTDGSDFMDFLMGHEKWKTRLTESSCRAFDMARDFVNRDHANGDVTWNYQGRPVIRDTKTEVIVLALDERAVEIALRLAIKKFGPRIRVHGDEVFKEAVARIAAGMEQPVSFVDPVMQLRMEKIQSEKKALEE